MEFWLIKTNIFSAVDGQYKRLYTKKVESAVGISHVILDDNLAGQGSTIMMPGGINLGAQNEECGRNIKVH